MMHNTIRATARTATQETDKGTEGVSKDIAQIAPSDAATLAPSDRNAPRKIRVLLADDHRMILEMLALFLTDSGGMDVVTAQSFDEAAAILHDSGPFDVVLLDLTMPGMNGIAGLKRAIRMNQGLPVAIITGNPGPRMLQEIMAAGAAGLILKTTAARSLTNAIQFIHSGERYLPMELICAPSEPNPVVRNGQLSDKEVEVLAELAGGKPNKEIAKALNLAEPTVKMHVTSICRKIGAQNRTQAVVLARDLGLV
jgi:two-component system, NarL family, nitrate/nitrite response regulator NarL